MAIPETSGKQLGAADEAGGNIADSVICRVGQLTRALHDNLRELGYDRRLEKAASEVPEARDRLAYVAVMTEQAA
ncbi:MAG: protein phosphatase CheZ, partial [Betaproteobacteria bacterium]|nr:protein phosphatase CheZ [Betaproteobacteria bacterium]